MPPIAQLLNYLWLLANAKFDRLISKLSRLFMALKGVHTSIKPDEERWVVMRDGGRRVRVQIYRNEAACGLRLRGGKSPVLINWHGGGFIIDRQGQDRNFFQHILQHPSISGQPLTIIDANYSHAPEHPFPAAIHDAIDVTSWVFANKFGEWDTSKVVLNGFSAGGNLALATSAFFGRNSTNPIKGVIAFYPACDSSKPQVPAQTCRPADPKTRFPGFVIPDYRWRLFFNSYYRTYPDPSVCKSPLASPFYADKKAFPAKLLLFTCEYDTLREEGEAMRKKLEGTVDVRGWVVPGVGHGWEHLVGHPGQKGFPDKVKAYDSAAELVAEIVRGD